MIPWIIIAVGVLLLFSSLKEGAKAWPSAAGAIVIGIGVVALGKSFGWLAIGAGVLGLMFLLISLKAVTRLLAGAALIGMVLGGVLSIDLDDDDDTEAVADDNTATTTTTTAPDSNCEPGMTPADCLDIHADNGEADPEVAEQAQTIQTVSRERNYGLGNTTCESGCVLQGGITGASATEMFNDLLAKGIMSPALLDDAARTVLGTAYTDTRPVGDVDKAASDLEIVLEFVQGAGVEEGVIPAGTVVWNTVVRDGQVVQFQYTTRRDRRFVSITKNGVTLMFFDTCGNRVSLNPTPGVPEVPEEEVPHDDDGKDHTESPVSDDPNDPDERVRPNIPPPPEVIRPEPTPGSTTTTQPPPPSTMPEDPPEVQDPEPIEPGIEDEPPTDDDPVEDGPCGDADGDGIPDDC
jgi:hypothetical protein